MNLGHTAVRQRIVSGKRSFALCGLCARLCLLCLLLIPSVSFGAEGTAIIVYKNEQAGINVEKANNVLISACVASVNKHPHVGNAGQQYGIFISRGAKNVMVHGNMSYDNMTEQIVDETKAAKILDNF